jgi:F0F1-type ATP synthase assembly protein I
VALPGFDAAGVHNVPIAQLIQLAVTPIFLLSGVGVILGVLTNRLARVVDRARRLEDALREGRNRDELEPQLAALGRRARIMNRAITLSTICALLVALVVVTLFLSAFLDFDLSTPIALMFIFAMLSLIGALLMFLREVVIAIRSLQIGPGTG